MESLVDAERQENAQPLIPASGQEPGQRCVAFASGTYALVSHVVLCAVFGLATAWCLKNLTYVVVGGIIAAFVLLQVLAYYGYVSLEWEDVRATARSVKADVRAALDVNPEGGHVGVRDLKRGAKKMSQKICGALVAVGMPSIIGFVAGFLVGWKVFHHHH